MVADRIARNISVPPKSGETMGTWARREAARMEMVVNEVNNPIQKRRKKEKLAKASRRKNRRK